MIEINGQTHPIQEWNDDQLHISNYLGNGQIVKFNDKINKNQIKPGSYGICDAGTASDIEAQGESFRTTWYVGYHFTDDEIKNVLPKVMAKKDSIGLRFTKTADAWNFIKPTQETGDVTTVWMKVF